MARASVSLLPQDAPFFTVKLQVQVLPCVVMFVGGVSVATLTGFEDFGGRDDFSTEAVESKLLAAGAVERPVARAGDDEDDGGRRQATSIRNGIHKTASDEDSDFE